MKVKKTACIGSGVIGSSWGTNFALKGVDVALYDVSDDVLKLAKGRVEINLEYLADNDALDRSKIQEILGRISYTTKLEEAVRDAQFVQENVPENYEAKHAIVEEFEKYAPADAIFASSTSGLLITEIAKHAKHPERFIGAHPYNPPHLIPLVEISKGDKTAPEVVQAGKEFFLAMGKEPVVLNKEVLGFISNRLQSAITREICELVTRGACTVEDADKALTFGPGIRWGIMGPSLVYHLGGGESGIDGLLTRQKMSMEMRLADMAAWTHYPDDWPQRARAGVDEEIKNRSAETGNTAKSLAEYRDKMLIALLKLHKKL
jgi:3-hydroxyacyl-CoA dehydrogenase